MPNHFMVVENHDNWLKTKERNFTEKAFKDSQPNIIRSIELGDFLVYYISSSISALSGIVEVTSPMYKRTELYWDDFYNIRFKTKPIIILEEGQFVPIQPLVGDLNFIKNKLRWRSYVYHSIRAISPGDFDLMRTAILEAHRRV